MYIYIYRYIYIYVYLECVYSFNDVASGYYGLHGVKRCSRQAEVMLFGNPEILGKEKDWEMWNIGDK